MKAVKSMRGIVVGIIAAWGLQVGSVEAVEFRDPIDIELPPIVFPFPYSDLIILYPGESFKHNFLDADPVFQNTGFKLNSLGGVRLDLDILSGFDPALGIDLQAHTIQENFVLIDGTLGLSLAITDPNGARRGIRINYRMDVRRDSLRGRALLNLVRARRSSGFDQWGRENYNGLRAIPRREGRAIDARMIDARLMRRDEVSGRWGRAVNAVRGRADIRWMGDSEPDGILGHHGYNNEKGFVWATLDVNSEYAVAINFDHDDDDILNAEDNCPMNPNTAQTNTDGADDGGDACDPDDDNDTIEDTDDNCPRVANEDQTDFDANGVGFACETDDDGDGVFGGLDLCPTTFDGVVNAEGCGVADLCPCDNGWKNHGKYVKCVVHTADDFVQAGLITEVEKDAISSAAGQSACGAKK